MHIGPYKFSPRLIPTLVTIILLPVFISLGLWQLDRAGQKRAVQVHMLENIQQPRFELRQQPADSREMIFRKVEVRGRFDQHHYLLDNRIWQGQVGYDVLTPFHYSGGVILVNRGWVSITPDRSRLPEFPSTTDEVSLKGVLAHPPGKLLELDGSAQLDALKSDWPHVVQQVDIAHMNKQLGYTMAPLMLHLEADGPHGFKHHWAPYVDKPQKSISYAIQWFSFATILVLLFFTLNTKRIRQEDDE